MAVLVAASPCALAIATPSAVLSGVARAGRGGVLVGELQVVRDVADVERELIVGVAVREPGRVSPSIKRSGPCVRVRVA